MSKRIIVNVGGYGDFDMPYVEASLLAPEYMSKKEINNIVQQVTEENLYTRDTTKAIEVLKREGFEIFTNVDLLVGGGL